MSVDVDQAWPTRQLLIMQRLRERRYELGLTQKQVVTRLARCGLRTTNRALSSLEHGAGLEVAKLPALAGALDCTVTYLVGLTDDPHRWEPDHALRAGSARDAAPAPLAMVAAASHSLILGSDVPDRRGSGGLTGHLSTS
jgi:transcriptional regulator with XRE-family HTH domain